MRIPRQVFTVVGAAALLAAIALGGASFSLQGDSDVHAVGEFTPSPDPTADPTTDPCVQQPSGITGFGVECTPTEEAPPFTHTPTPQGTSEPTEPAATEPASTTVPSTPIPAVTSTPSGDAGAGDLTPPSTGSNGDSGAGSLGWMLVAAGLALAAGGTAALGYGLRKD